MRNNTTSELAEFVGIPRGREPEEWADTGTPRLEVRDTMPAEAAHVFTDLLLSELPNHYDDVDATFPASILQNTINGHDPFGYFTVRKKLYTSYVDGRFAGFTVVTMKRGGSAKIGPTGVLPAFRRTGVASRLRDIVERRLYEEHNVRKLYMTIATSNVAALLFNLGRGFQIEGVLRGQYRADRDELVLGAFNPAAHVRTRPAVRPSPPAWSTPYPTVAQLWSDPTADALERYLGPRLVGSFDGLDSDFYHAVIDACGQSRQSYHQKGKRLLVARSRGVICGAAVYVPKRGGAVKLSPCVADTEAAALALVEKCASQGRLEGRRKMYTHIPDSMMHLAELLISRGLVVEAQLRDAYKPGVNMLVLGQML